MENFDAQLQAKNNETNLAIAMKGQRIQEVQAMVFMAKQFPRDEIRAVERIKVACTRKDLADVAMYEYSRGGQKVTGASIRLAEVIAQNWGNIKCGVIEIDNTVGESKAMSYAWDIETNMYDEKVFTVKHTRDTKQGTKTLTANRDIYEVVANDGARRKRACILSVVPAWVIAEAIKCCENTLTSGNSVPLIDRLRIMFDKYKSEFGVTKEMIETYLGYKVESFTEKDGLRLSKIFTSLKDGASKIDDYFTFEKPSNPSSEIYSKLDEDFKKGSK